MPIHTLPGWLAGLEPGDLQFLKTFLLASGSLKEAAQVYGVSYPTVRLRLDRLIQKVQAAEQADADPYIEMIRHLSIDGKIETEAAKQLIAVYREQKKEE